VLGFFSYYFFYLFLVIDLQRGYYSIVFFLKDFGGLLNFMLNKPLMILFALLKPSLKLLDLFLMNF
jgi:hypothetical protein